MNSFKIEAFNPRQTQTGSNPTTMWFNEWSGWNSAAISICSTSRHIKTCCQKRGLQFSSEHGSLASSEKRTQSSLNNKRCVFVDRFKCIEMMRNTCRGGRNLWIEQAVLRIYIRVQFNISQEISVRYIPYWKY